MIECIVKGKVFSLSEKNNKIFLVKEENAIVCFYNQRWECPFYTHRKQRQNEWQSNFIAIHISHYRKDLINASRYPIG